MGLLGGNIGGYRGEYGTTRGLLGGNIGGYGGLIGDYSGVI